MLSIITHLGIMFFGFVAGALSRQPEINELKSQIKELQNEVEKLQNLINIQHKQLNDMRKRYNELKKWQVIEKNRQKRYIQGGLIFQYAFTEYMGMLIEADVKNSVNLNSEEIKFYNAFGYILTTREITEENRKIVFKYIKERYLDEIDSFQESDQASILNYFNEGE